MSEALDILRLPRRRIGGSDAAPACGVEVYGKNRITLWEELTGRRERANATSRPIRRGNTLEDWIGQEYALATEQKVRRRLKPIVNARYPWMRANIDRRVANTRVILECKSVHPLALWRGEEWGEPGSDDVPPHYLLQCVHYNICAEAQRTDLAAMFGDELRIYHIGRTSGNAKALEARVIELEHDLWRCAERDEPPRPMTAAEVRTLHPSDDASPIVAMPEHVADVERLAVVMSESKALELEWEQLAERLQVYIGECAELIDERGKTLVTWKKAKDSSRTNYRHALELVGHYLHANSDHPSTWPLDLCALAAWLSTEQTAGTRRFLLKKRNAK
jgi:putative phage-type endonuclease